MLTKSLRLTKVDAVGLAEIIQKDPRIEHGASEALRICFEDAAANITITSWKEISEKAKKLNNSAIEIEESLLETTKTFLVDEEVFHIVRNSIIEELGLSRPRISFIARLCIYNARLNLYSEKEESEKTEMKIKNVDAIDLFIHVNNKTAELIREGRIIDIEKYLEV